MPLLEFTDRGIYCAQADVYIDPWRPVNRALITHGHADHARWGHKSYLCTRLAKPVIRFRLGPISVETVEYGEKRTINGVHFSFHPAGHIIGSAQIRVEYKGEVWVASGDYKIEDDGLATPFEPIPCHTFITESTFGLPVYEWQPQQNIMADINTWWRANTIAGKVSVISSYALGKAQRVMNGLDTSIGPILTHGAVENTNEILRLQGISLPETLRVVQGMKKKSFQNALVIAPPSAVGSTWIKKFQPYSLGIASGWMTLRGARRRRNADRGFILSDHADWKGLNEAITATGADRIIVTHGYTQIFSKWLNEQGYDAYAKDTEFEGEPNEEKDDTLETDQD
ncbi:MAG: ligase-associated DNA damage response exonuclease [Saprospiraceae bacterium]|nr:ligase-associated DNA damage response exonuclease [Saprospiraceae bacterium]